MARLPRYSYSDMDSEHWVKQKEKELRKQIDSTALPIDPDPIEDDTAKQEFGYIWKTIAVSGIIFALGWLGVSIWIG